MAKRPLSLHERLQHRIATTLMRLPPKVQQLLSRQPPIVRDGLTLDPELQLLLSLRKVLGAKSMSSYPPAEGRRRLRREAQMHAGVPTPVGSVRDFPLDTAVGALPARHYAPLSADARAPLLLFFHGGGFVLGDLETHDGLCRELCHNARVHVLAVEYRLAPEAPFPAAVEDALAAYRWTLEHAASLGADAARIAVGGDSAGGNLAAVISQVARDEGMQPPALQLLIYPAVDRRERRPSLDLFADGFFLTGADIDWFTRQYSGPPKDDARNGPVDPRLSPLSAKLSNLPPALVVTAGFDPLRDEGEAYAAALKGAGVRAVVRRFDGLIHGFANMTGVSPACRSAVVEMAALVRELLAHDEGRQREVG